MDPKQESITTKSLHNKNQETCRLCGSLSNCRMHDIFDNSKDVLEQISFCVPIIILSHDPYPQKICEPCFESLAATVSFIEKCVATDQRFRWSDEVYIRTMNINHLPLDGPAECEICKMYFTDMSLFDIHIEQHKTKLDRKFHLIYSRHNSKDGLVCVEGENDYSQYKNSLVYKCHSDKLFSSQCKLVEDNDHGNIQKTINGLDSKKVISETDTKRQVGKDMMKVLVTDVKKKTKEKILDTCNNQQSKKQKKMFTCTFCHENFPSNKDLRAHSIEIHNSAISADWVCKFCNKSMTTKVGLLIHERIHYGSKPYICEWCGNGFRSRANLTQHQVIHTGVRKYSCSRCNKKFSRRSFVETHMRVHTGERPYCCDICGYRFTQIGDMRRHRNKHQTYPAYTSPNIKSDQLAIE